MSLSNIWDSPPTKLQLASKDIHIWRVLLQPALIKARTIFGLLANDEVERALRYHFQRDYDCFVIVRGVLRILLGAYLQIPPEYIRFQYSARGRPSLALDQNGVMLDFNVSHSHEMALLAFARDSVVGVDLEYVRPDIVHEQIAERFFSTQEIASLRALPKNLQPTAFFNCWTRKEAFIKATGEGLFRPLDQFSMSLIPGEAARLISIQEQPEELSQWFVQDLSPSPGYVAALVAKVPITQLSLWECPQLQHL